VRRVGRAGIAAVAVASSVLLVAGALGREPEGSPVLERAPVRRAAIAVPRAEVVPVSAPVAPVAVPSPGQALLGGDPVAPPERTADPPPPVRTGTFEELFPAQRAAAQDLADPATTRWAVLVGVNEHASRSVRDNIGSRQDAEDLRAHLLSLGWRDDHIVLLTDRAATGANIEAALAWLAEKATPASEVAVFHYSGHGKVAAGLDDDPEVVDEALWPTDDAFVADSRLVELLDGVDARRTWISVASCNAAGLADPGMARPGRVLTFSSGEPQKSYEHPDWGNSVWGHWLIEQAMRERRSSPDGTRLPSVEEAWAWAAPRATATTSGQRFGSQDAVLVDQVEGPLHLEVPGVVPPAPAPGERTTPPPPAGPEQPGGPQQPEGSERERETTGRHGGYLCVLCG